MPKMTARRIRTMKTKGQRIPVVTAYDYTMARLADRAGFPIILVGDSLGMVCLGYDSTIPVTMDDMVRHTRAVARGTEHALVVTDMPFMSFQPSIEAAMKNAGRLVQEGGAQSVKLEGAGPTVEKVRRIVEAGIPVMGHLGLTPQSVHQFGGYRVQGKARNDALRLLQDARELQDAGCYALVLELVPAPLARIITQKLTITTIGIGAGPHCDGQVQVIHDILGLYDDFVPRHTRQYLKLSETITAALAQYAQEVRDGAFPTDKESFDMDESLLQDLLDG